MQVTSSTPARSVGFVASLACRNSGFPVVLGALQPAQGPWSKQDLLASRRPSRASSCSTLVGGGFPALCPEQPVAPGTLWMWRVTPSAIFFCASVLPQDDSPWVQRPSLSVCSR